MIYLVTKQNALFENENYKVISVEESLSLLNSLTIVGLDVETEGLDPWTKKLKSIQLGNYDFQVVIDTTTIDPTLYKDYLESNRLFVGWNLKFDLKFLFKQGIVPRKVWDGYLAEKLMWLGYPSGIHSLSLKAAGEHYLDIELDKSVRGKIIYAGLTDDVIIYSANDVKYLEKIMELQQLELAKKGLEKAIIYENKFVLPLAYCEYCGVKLDVDKWKAKMQKDEQRVKTALDNCNKWLLENEPDSNYIFIDRQGDIFNGFNLEPQVTLNWNSAKQLIPLFKKYGVNVTIEDREKGGTKDSIDAKSLKPQKDKCSLIPLYLEYKEAIKVTSTYGENFLKQINPVSGRIHTNYQQMGADKGNKWISIDYSGQETYLMASIANDSAIIEELTNGSGDIHSLTAYMSYQEIPRDTNIKDIKKNYHNLRQEAKGIEFAINYGGDANTISRNKGIPIEEATKIYNSYMSGFKGLKKYQDFRRKDWFDKGYILLNPLTGHKAYIYDYEKLQEDKKWMSTLDWNYYREMKNSCPECDTVQRVRHFFKRKSASEKQSINYPIK